MSDHRLSASQFVEAFFRDMPLSPSADGAELRGVERAILHVVPEAAGLARRTAEGRLWGEPLRRECVAVSLAVQRLEELAAPLYRPLFKARIAAGLPARTYDAAAQGASATAALVHVASRIVAAVYEAASDPGLPGVAEDDDPVHDADSLTYDAAAVALGDLFRNRFAFPDPAPLVHEMQAELMQLETMRRPASDVPPLVGGAPLLDDPPADPPATVPMPAAAREKAGDKGVKKGKGKGKADGEGKAVADGEPLAPVDPHPVYVVNEHLRVIVESGGPVAPSPGLPIIFRMGELCYQVTGATLAQPVTEAEDVLLRAFIGAPAMNEDTMKNRTKNPDAARVFRTLKNKYQGYFAQALHSAKAKGSTGYQAQVREK